MSRRLTIPPGTQRLTPEEVAAAPRRRKQLERVALQMIDNTFRRYRWMVERPVEDVRVGISGIPDRLYTSTGGIQLWVEGKRPATVRNQQGHVRAAQIRWLTAKRERGVPCLVAVDFRDVEPIAKAYATAGPDAMEELLAECDRRMETYEWWPR